MVVVNRPLMQKFKMFLMDEASLGYDPLLVQPITQAIETGKIIIPDSVENLLDNE